MDKRGALEIAKRFIKSLPAKYNAKQAYLHPIREKEFNESHPLVSEILKHSIPLNLR